MKNTKKFVYKDHFEEYSDLMKLKEAIYFLSDEHLKPIPFNEKKIEFNTKTININV